MAAPDLDVPWSDGRQDLETRVEHARPTRRLHDDPAYHRSALRGLARGRRRRQWSDDAILTAIREFHFQAGRWPGQHDFRSASDLPGYGTVQRRFGSTTAAVQLASR